MGGATGGRSLEETPRWAVAAVCFVLVAISMVIERLILLVEQWLKKKQKRALHESLEKIKSELMLMGFISLLLTVGRGPISYICISTKIGATWHPCNKNEELTNSNDNSEFEEDGEVETRRKLLAVKRILVAAAGTDKCAAKGKVPFVSSDGIHQLHIFIFVLALFHVLYCILTMALGRFKMRKWKAWEKETRTVEYQFSHDPERLRFARETSFGRRHMSFWSNYPVLLWIVCFFRQFIRSVPKVDYLTLRHGFILAHLAPQSHTNFNFQKYINRSLEEDFKVVVGISPPIWLFAVIFLLSNTHGWRSYLWLPFVPLIIILLVGTKLQVIITKMGLRVQDKGEIVKGAPLVQPGDELFWFNRPRLILYLINFVLFQNAFQLAFFAWTWYEFGLKSCFHERTEDVVVRITMGVIIQILCSYVTLPLYALVTQMGSTMKSTIFSERIVAALRNWHHTAKKHIKQNKRSCLTTPMSSRSATPSHQVSSVHLLRHYRCEMDSLQTSPRKSNFDNEQFYRDIDGGSPSPSHHQGRGGGVGGDGGDRWSTSQHHLELSNMGPQDVEGHAPSPSQMAPFPQAMKEQHEICIGGPKDFSFDWRRRI